jgi:PAS domain-containing protein
LFALHQQQIYAQTDRMFAVLMVVQWAAGIGAALWISPQSWTGPYSQIHIHVWAAVFLGGIIMALPVALAMCLPGKAITRHTVAVAQMLFSGLLIHLTGGRIETHFHVFGSLAFLAFYRDWRVLMTATVVVAGDHFLRGLYWPESVYGVLSASWWRSMEHAGWVVFEDIILVRWCMQGNREMREIADRTAELEATNASIEQTVIQRTIELRASEDFARNILNAAHDAFVAINMNGEIIEWNRQAEIVFDWNREQVMGLKISDIVVPLSSREAHVAGLKKFLETGDGPVLRRRLEMINPAKPEPSMNIVVGSGTGVFPPGVKLVIVMRAVWL